jgi:hypothetical protein
VNGTPTFFMNGERYDGARDLRQMLSALTAQGSETAKVPLEETRVQLDQED